MTKWTTTDFQHFLVDMGQGLDPLDCLCDNCEDEKLDEDNYVGTDYGHYCSWECRDEAEEYGEDYSDYELRMIERKQMGLDRF